MKHKDKDPLTILTVTQLDKMKNIDKYEKK